MCIGVPSKIVEINDNMAIAEVGGVQRQTRLDLLSEVNIGDYVIIHAGFAIQKIDAEEAVETLRLIREMTDEVS